MVCNKETRERENNDCVYVGIGIVTERKEDPRKDTKQLDVCLLLQRECLEHINPLRSDDAVLDILASMREGSRV